MADNVIPLINDYDFSTFTDEELSREIEITQAILDQVVRMIAENNRQIDLSDDVNGRTRLVAILTAEQGFKTDKLTALTEERDRRNE